MPGRRCLTCCNRHGIWVRSEPEPALKARAPLAHASAKLAINIYPQKAAFLADWRVLVGFLGQTAIAARCSAMVLAEAEARRLRALYPDSRAVVWVARSAASSTTRWSALERKLKDEAEAGNATEVYGISGRVQADRRVQESVRRAIRLALADLCESCAAYGGLVQSRAA